MSNATTTAIVVVREEKQQEQQQAEERVINWNVLKRRVKKLEEKVCMAVVDAYDVSVEEVVKVGVTTKNAVVAVGREYKDTYSK